MMQTVPRVIAALLCVLIACGTFVSTAEAAIGVPRIMNYQGRLMNASGTLLGGSGTDYCVRFSLYDDSAVGGADTKLWPTGSPSTMTVVVRNGIFNAGIGDTGAGGDTLNFNFEDTDAAYLNVEVATKVGATCAPGDGAESFENLSPRQRVTAAGYAVNSATLNGMSASQIMANSFSTTSAAYNLNTYDKGFFFSTTSVNFWDAQQYRWATTSSNAWLATKTSDDVAQGVSNLYYSNALVNSFVGSSTTIPKAFSNNTFTGVNAFQGDTTLGNATTSNFSILNTISGAGLTSCSGSGDKLTWNSSTRQFACGADAGAGGGITAIGAEYSLFQTGASQTFATSSDTNIGMTIVSSGDVHTFTPVWQGTLAAARGGTGLSSVAASGLLIGGAGNTWAQVGTSSLGLPTFNDLNGFMSLSGWYATTTDALDEGVSNLYYTNGRVAGVIAGTTTDALAEGATNRYYADGLVQTYLNGVNKGFFFATSSADAWKNQTNFHSTTSLAFNLGTYDKGYFFSTTSVNFWESTQSRWATTSATAWLATKDTDDLAEGINLYFTANRVAGVIAGTTTDALAEGSTNRYYSNGLVQTYLNGIDKGYFFSTTSAAYYAAQNPTAFSTTSANYYVQASSTIPKTYSDNTFTGVNAFGNITAAQATTTTLFSTFASSTEVRANVASLGSVTAGSSTVSATSTTNGLFASFARLLSSFVDSLTASVATIYTSTIGSLTATSSATLASTTAYGRFITGNVVATSTTGTSTFAGALSVGIANSGYEVSVLGTATGATGATGTAVMAISNNDNTLSSGNNVLRLNMRTPYGTACVTGTTCPRFEEYFAGVGAGADTGGRGVGSLRLSTAGTGITQTSGAADFAEFMQLSETAAVGDIVSLNRDGEYRKAVAGESLIGVVSDNAAFVGNASIEGQPNAHIVGFAGVIRTNVSDANGAINAGDLIAASDVPGVGIKLSESGFALGQALESFSGGTGVISILVLPKYVDAAVALESYGGGASGTSGYWDLSTSTGFVSLASTTYALAVDNATINTLTTTGTTTGSNGFNISSGCFAVGGVCIGSNTGALGAQNTWTGINTFTNNVTLTNATSTSLNTSVLGLGGINYFTSLTGSGLLNSSGILTLDRGGDWTGTLDGMDGSYLLANSFSTSSAAYFLSQNQGNAFSTSSAAYFASQNPTAFSTSSANYFLQGSTTVPKTFSDNTFTGSNSFQNVTAAGVTSTASFATTASSSNLFSNIANIGSLVASVFTGNVITATNATTTNLYTNFASTTAINANAANIGTATAGSLTLGNALSGANGGTGLSSVSQNALLIGGAGNTWTQVSTSSLGLVAFSDLGAYMGLAQWYATTTDALAEGSNNRYFTVNRVAAVLAATTTDALAEGATNRYYQDSRVQTYLNGVNKGFFFATSSADAWKNQTNFHSTTSLAFNLGTYDKGYFFSTTSVSFWESTQNRWATTSANAWLATKSTSDLAEGINLYYTPSRVAGVIAGTTTDALAEGSTNRYYSNGLVQTYLNGIDKGYFFSTTSAAYYAAQNPVAFSTTSADYYVNASTTIPKTYSNNTFTGTNAFQNVTASGVTSTASFSGTASSTNLFSTIANIGSAVVGAFTGNTVTATNATTTSFAITNLTNSLLRTTSAGSVAAAAAGIDYVATTTGNWLGTFDGQDGSYYLANSFSTTSAAYNLGTYDKGYFFSTTSVNFWESTQNRWATTSANAWLATKSTTDLPEGTNLYYTASRVAGVIAGTTTDALAEGATNRYYQDSRVQTYLNGVNKGFFFSTSSASAFSAAGLSFSTTSTDFWRAQNNFFSTTSASHFSSLGLAFSTTSAQYFLGQNQGTSFSTTSANYYVNASTTIPKTYSNNTYSGSNTFNGSVSMSNATSSAVNTNLLGIGGTNYFSSLTGTGLSNVAGVLTVNQGAAFSTTSVDYWKSINNFHSTTSLAFNLGTYDKGYFFSTTSVNFWESTQNRWATTSANAWLATKSTTDLPEGTNLYYTASRVAGVIAGTTTDALAEGSTNQYFTSGRVNTFIAGSTTIPKTFSNNTFTGTNTFNNITAAGATTTALSTGSASTTNLTISSILNSLLYTGPGGVVAAAGVSAPLSFTGGVLSIQQGTGAQNGYISSADWNMFNSRLSTTTLGLFDKGFFFSTTSVAYWDSTQFRWATSSTDYYMQASSTVPTTYKNNTFIGVNSFANITATGATSTTFFAGTASSTNIFATTARFGSLASFSLTGSIAAAGNNITGAAIASSSDLVISNVRNSILATNAQGNVVASSSPTAATFNATSVTAASQLPYASSTAISVLQQLSIGAANGTILQGSVAGTSTFAGFLNVTGTNSTSTFSGGVSAARLNITAGTSTSVNGFNILNGCFSINGACTVSSVTATNTSLTVSPNNGSVGISLNLGNPNVWSGLQTFTNATSTSFEALRMYARTIVSTSTNALQLQSNFASTAGLTFGSTSTPQMLALDTINNRVTFGTGGANPSLLVLDTKNTGGDPTGVDGSMYYNSNAGVFRCYNGGWVTCGGEAASSTGDVQFRNVDGSFAATNKFNWSIPSNTLVLTGASSTQTTDIFAVASSSNRVMFALNGMGIMSLSSTTDPVNPSSGELNIYAKDIAGRLLPKWVGPSGVDTPFQAGLGFNRTALMMPAGGGTATTFTGGYGSTFTNVCTTCANPTPATTNLLTSTRRATYATGGTANTIVSHRQSTLQVTRGNASNIGGFFFTIRFGTSVLATGNRVFVGLSDSVAAPTNIDPLVTGTGIGRVGMAINTNTGNWSFVHNVSGTAPTVLNLGANFPVNTTGLYELILFARPNDTIINYRVTNLSTGATVSSTTLATNIPTNTTFLAPQFWMVNVAAANATFDFGGWYLESDQ